MADTEALPTSLRVLAFGPCFVGWLLHIGISGMCLQSLIHLLHMRRGEFSTRTKALLLAVCVFNAFSVALTFTQTIHWGTLSTQDPAELFGLYIADGLTPLPAALTAAAVQTFFALRAWEVTQRSWTFLACIALCIAAALGGGITIAAMSVRAVLSPETVDFGPFVAANQLWLWSSAATDLLISLVLISSLYRQRSKLLWSTTEQDFKGSLTRVINRTIQTASLTTLFAVPAAVINLITYKNNSTHVYLAFQYALPAVYTYSYLWCLESMARQSPAATEEDLRTDRSRSLRSFLNRSPVIQTIPDLQRSSEIDALEDVGKTDLLVEIAAGPSIEMATRR